MSYNALPLLDRAADTFQSRLKAAPGSQPLPEPSVGPLPSGLTWRNVLMKGQKFRRAHLETFNVAGRLSVLHVCIFPHLSDPSPIFGFDVVAGPARVTGIFLDLSPVVDREPKVSLHEILGRPCFQERRAPPSWGNVFSPDFLAIRPVDLQEVESAIDMAVTAMDHLLTMPRQAAATSSRIAQGQDRYIRAQRQNEHTFRMLSGFIGPSAARAFIDQVLFPLEQPVMAG